MLADAKPFSGRSCLCCWRLRLRHRRRPAPLRHRQFAPMSLLLFGDHGYQLDYLEEEERNPGR